MSVIVHPLPYKQFVKIASAGDVATIQRYYDREGDIYLFHQAAAPTVFDDTQAMIMNKGPDMFPLGQALTNDVYAYCEIREIQSIRVQID